MSRNSYERGHPLPETRRNRFHAADEATDTETSPNDEPDPDRPEDNQP